ncbi:MAG: DUF1330 domain-containing protein [Actinomycetota bacterium]
MKKITWPALMAAVLILAACGSDDSEADGTEDTEAVEDTDAVEDTEVVEDTMTDEPPEDTTADESSDPAAADTTEAVEDTTTSAAAEDTTAESSDPAAEDASEEAADPEAAPTPPGVDQLMAAGEEMIVVNQLSPSTEEQIAEFQQPGPDGPIYMVNLLEFKEVAEYEDGRETDLTGREAYALYAEGQRDVLPLFGAEVVFEGDVSFLTIGQVEELWDEVAIVRYPSRATLLEMSASPEFQAVEVHRIAGLEGQLNIETVGPGTGP